MKTNYNLERFDYKEIDSDQRESINTIRNSVKQLYINIINNCPDSSERDLAIQSLEISSMWANKAISHNPKKEQ